jgi:hypothetical protein
MYACCIFCFAYPSGTGRNNFSMFTVSTVMPGIFLGFKLKGDSSTDNLKYMDRIETQGGCVTGDERVDLKRKSGLATEKMN